MNTKELKNELNAALVNFSTISTLTLVNLNLGPSDDPNTELSTYFHNVKKCFYHLASRPVNAAEELFKRYPELGFGDIDDMTSLHRLEILLSTTGIKNEFFGNTGLRSSFDNTLKLTGTIIQDISKGRSGYPRIEKKDREFRLSGGMGKRDTVLDDEEAALFSDIAPYLPGIVSLRLKVLIDWLISDLEKAESGPEDELNDLVTVAKLVTNGLNKMVALYTK